MTFDDDDVLGSDDSEFEPSDDDDDDDDDDVSSGEKSDNLTDDAISGTLINSEWLACPNFGHSVLCSEF